MYPMSTWRAMLWIIRWTPRWIWQAIRAIPWSVLSIHDKGDSHFLKWAPYSVLLWWIVLAATASKPSLSVVFGGGSVLMYAMYIFLARMRRRSRIANEIANEQFIEAMVLANLAQAMQGEVVRAPIELWLFSDGTCRRCTQWITPDRPAVQCAMRRHLIHVGCLEEEIDYGWWCPSCPNPQVGIGSRFLRKEVVGHPGLQNL